MKRIFLTLFIALTVLNTASVCLCLEQEYQSKDGKPKPELYFQINSYVLQSININTGQFRVLDVLTNEIKIFNTHSFMGSMFVRQVKSDRVVFDSFEWLLKKDEQKETQVDEEVEKEEEVQEDDDFATFEDILFEEDAADESIDNMGDEKK